MTRTLILALTATAALAAPAFAGSVHDQILVNHAVGQNE